MRNDLKTLAEKLEAAVLAPFILGAARSAQAVVKDLQERGPAWSGEFSNSWEIATASKVSSGSGAAGAPQRIAAPILTPSEYKFKPTIKYYIANKAPHADIALDITGSRDKYTYPGYEPIKDKKFITTGTRLSSRRGDVAEGAGKNRSTAPLDWYPTYIQGRQLDKTINLYMEESMRNVKL